MKEEWAIRYSTKEDVIFLKKWLESLQDLRWFPMSLPEEVEWAAHHWIGFSQYRASLTVTMGNIPCAIGTLFLMPYKKVAHHCTFYMIVDPLHRRKGIGYSLLRNLLHLAKSQFRLESVHVEIFEGCPLLPLLMRAGFSSFAKQEFFVKEEKGYLARILLEHVFGKEEPWKNP